GYRHASVLRPDAIPEKLSEEDRIQRARDASMPLLAERFEGAAVVDAIVPRVMATKGLIEAGIESPADVDRVAGTYRTQGVLHDGEMVPLVFGRMEDGRLGVTTGLHVEREREFVAL